MDANVLFFKRINSLMEQNDIKSARALAKAMYEAGIVTVDTKDGDVISSMARRIQEHTSPQVDVNRLTGRYIKAYCDFFHCSSDYLLGYTDVISDNSDVRSFCEATKLSEKAVSRLIEPLDTGPDDSLKYFWSRMLESAAFYMMPMHFHMAAYELGKYKEIAKKQGLLEKAEEKMNSSDKFVEAYYSMMNENYMKEAEPHKNSYFMHMNELMSEMSECLEQWANQYADCYRETIERFFSDKQDAKHQKLREEFLEKMDDDDNIIFGYGAE